MLRRSLWNVLAKHGGPYICIHSLSCRQGIHHCCRAVSFLPESFIFVFPSAKLNSRLELACLLVALPGLCFSWSARFWPLCQHFTICISLLLSVFNFSLPEIHLLVVPLAKVINLVSIYKTHVSFSPLSITLYGYRMPGWCLSLSKRTLQIIVYHCLHQQNTF